MVGPYEPDEVERRMLSDDGINPGRLFALNPENVWRHADTKSQYQRFSSVRLRSIFELLDLKSQLRAMDRAHLLGGTNFIVLVKKSDKDRPAKPAELQALQANVRNLSRVPVIVGDDRLSIEIITPKTDETLKVERYNGLDARITARVYQMFIRWCVGERVMRAWCVSGGSFRAPSGSNPARQSTGGLVSEWCARKYPSFHIPPQPPAAGPLIETRAGHARTAC